jgi:RNA polymerase sigma-70 factor, ECF subfamily
MHPGSERVRTLLADASAGRKEALRELTPLVYQELRQLARRWMGLRDRNLNQMQPTELVHDAWIRMAGQDATIHGRTHFFAVGAEMMRRIIVDRARARLRLKRGGGAAQTGLLDTMLQTMPESIDVLAMDAALKKLAELDPRQARITELRMFGGLTVAEVAEHLGVSQRTVEGEWTMIRAWFRRELGLTKSVGQS